jgi:hypothetical protein
MYVIALYLHFVALLLAFFATGLAVGGGVLLRRAQRIADARLGLALSAMAAKMHPLGALGLFLTGAYLTQTAWTWTTPWILCGIVGLLVVAVVGGGVIGARERALANLVQDTPEGPVLPALRAQLNDPLSNIGGAAISFFVLGIMFIMVTKPGLGGSVLSLVLAAAVGIAVGYATQPVRAARSTA